MALKLDRCRRWLCSKKFLKEQHSISVHFSDLHYNYYSAWKYVAKEDEHVPESNDHPDLWNSKAPKTSTACKSDDDLHEDSSEAAEKKSADEKERKSKKRKKRLEGKCDSAEFIVNRGPRVVAEVLNTAWEMTNAQDKLERSKKTRLELLQEAALGNCVTGCEGKWLTCALEVLQQNGRTFTGAIRDFLHQGHRKFRNIMICGPANSAKTFILNPLSSVYTTFCNPACMSFAWVGAEDAECIFLNDFRWSPQIIPWHNFLLMLEGQMVHLPAPKTHFAKDIVCDKDTPIFCTSKQPIIFIKNDFPLGRFGLHYWVGLMPKAYSIQVETNIPCPQFCRIAFQNLAYKI
ncbi:hypothetical protein P5673_018267 [Acropora cervicornis]|uniref:Uncharacterized protein n=1 Tax=Acropora cervicornis TaxID=6130 RepID=A0AAD9V2W9_ACRCE|nr:hypothetical protein P5673_018267 [Acropora cervicornis]